MEKYKDYFKDKKITVMGLGLLGRGIGDTAFLAECGAELIVTDVKSAEELQESTDQLKEFKNITYRLGEHVQEDFLGRDMILKAAGIPLNSTFIDIAKKDGAEIAMSGALFAKLSGIPIVGVTGTRGKSTVTHMIHHVLIHGTHGSSVLLGGNVRGVSNLQLLKNVESDSLAVMELDSWQLQGFAEFCISPHIAVFTNFMDDHLNYYHNNREAYFADKAQIFLHQEESGVFITTPDVFKQVEEFSKGKDISLGQEIILVDASELPSDCLLSMPGEHNRLNAALAFEALKATSLSEDIIAETLSSFPGVPGRLEYLGIYNGKKVYNDNNATTPEATVAGLKALGGDKNIVLIVGGSDKELSTKELALQIKALCKHVVLYSGTGTDMLKKHLHADISQSEFETLEACVEDANKSAEEGDIILFSPGFASFGKYYRNEYDRGDQFVDIINKY